MFSITSLLVIEKYGVCGQPKYFLEVETNGDMSITELPVLQALNLLNNKKLVLLRSTEQSGTTRYYYQLPEGCIHPADYKKP